MSNPINSHDRSAATGASTTPGLEPAAQLKLVLMRCIEESIRQQFDTLQEAARAANINRVLLSRIRAEDQKRCSIGTLFKVAERLNICLRIEVRLAVLPEVAITATK